LFKRVYSTDQTPKVEQKVSKGTDPRKETKKKPAKTLQQKKAGKKEKKGAK
jgi:hypothetical protein